MIFPLELYYMPSYEISRTDSVVRYSPDGRHVSQDCMESLKNFSKIYTCLFETLNRNLGEFMYDRKIKKWDEPHTPEKLELCLNNRVLNKGKFLSVDHFISYYLQMKTIHGLGVQTVLEIGPGEAFVAEYMKSLGIHFDTMDISEASKPTFLSTLEEFDGSHLVDQYDVVCAFQMLEHSPYENFIPNLKKMALLSKRYVFISLPYACWGGSLRLLFHRGQEKKYWKIFSIFFPLMKKNRKYRNEYKEEFPWAVHYWEIGRRTFMLKNVLQDIKSSGLNIIKKFHSDNPFHYFILAEKKFLRVN